MGIAEQERERKARRAIRIPDGRTRVVIENVRPEIDGGRFPIKRTEGEEVVVEADIFADGHALLAAALLHRLDGDPEWAELRMAPGPNDTWRGEFLVAAVGQYLYTVQAWVDQFGTWARDLSTRVQAQHDVTVELLIGAELVEAASRRVGEADARRLRASAAALRSGRAEGIRHALSRELAPDDEPPR